ncbi:MAG TPA: hypothetical protein VK703_09730 [Candidatus Acidoferrales bacterium]|nr:hypothetical protein [Candidatus Acidoferrales bacterium]
MKREPGGFLLESTVSNIRTRIVVPAGTVIIFFCGAGVGVPANIEMTPANKTAGKIL